MNTLARNRDAEEIVRRLRTLSPDSVRRWGRMSVHQMVCHLADSCRMATGEKPVLPLSSLMQRTLTKWIALYLPLRWPAGISTVPEIDQYIQGTNPCDFTADLAEVETLVVTLAARRNATWPIHPIFGTMSESEWLRW